MVIHLVIEDKLYITTILPEGIGFVVDMVHGLLGTKVVERVVAMLFFH